MSLLWFEMLEEEIEIDRREAIRRVLRNRRQLRNSSNPLELEEVRFQKLFRLPKNIFVELLDDIEPKMVQNDRTYGIPNILKLCCLLRFCAEGGYQTGVGNDFNIGLSQSAVSDVLKELLEIFENHVCPKWIQFTRTREEEEETKSAMFERSGIPGIIGCIDGTHIKIRAPLRELQHLYYNRKSFYSINAMVMCDHKMTINYINARFPGACHDAHVLNMSGLNSILEERETIYRRTNSWILGDAGYPLKTYLITPYRSTVAGSRERSFNKKHAKARVIVEQTIGVLKNRFRCILRARELHYSPEKCTKIINTCVALHNICIHHGIQFDEPADEEETFSDDEYEDVQQGDAIEARNRLLNAVV